MDKMHVEIKIHMHTHARRHTNPLPKYKKYEKNRNIKKYQYKRLRLPNILRSPHAETRNKVRQFLEKQLCTNALCSSKRACCEEICVLPTRVLVIVFAVACNYVRMRTSPPFFLPPFLSSTISPMDGRRRQGKVEVPTGSGDRDFPILALCSQQNSSLSPELSGTGTLSI